MRSILTQCWQILETHKSNPPSLRRKTETYKFNSSGPSDAHMCQWTRPSSVQIMSCRLVDGKPSSIVNWTLGNKFHWNSNKKKTLYIYIYICWKCHLQMGTGYDVLSPMTMFVTLMMTSMSLRSLKNNLFRPNSGKLSSFISTHVTTTWFAIQTNSVETQSVFSKIHTI